MKYMLKHYFSCKEEFSRTPISETEMVSLCKFHWCKRKPVWLYPVWLPPAEFLTPPHYRYKMCDSLWGCRCPEPTPGGCWGLCFRVVYAQFCLVTGRALFPWLLQYFLHIRLLWSHEYKALLYFLFRWKTSVAI